MCVGFWGSFVPIHTEMNMQSKAFSLTEGLGNRKFYNLQLTMKPASSSSILNVLSNVSRCASTTDGTAWISSALLGAVCTFPVLS